MRDKEYVDPFTFNPERFLGPNPPTDPHQYAFGFGRRYVRLGSLSFDLKSPLNCRIGSHCPGKDVASATVYMSIATTLKTFNIGKAKDASGKEIEPEAGWTTGLVMWVALFSASP